MIEFGLVNYTGMSDNISYNLADHDTMLQIPTIWPVKDVMPYLIRRAKKTLR
jgi:uncharacterized protein Usg